MPYSTFAVVKNIVFVFSLEYVLILSLSFSIYRTYTLSGDCFDNLIATVFLFIMYSYLDKYTEYQK